MPQEALKPEKDDNVRSFIDADGNYVNDDENEPVYFERLAKRYACTEHASSECQLEIQTMYIAVITGDQMVSDRIRKITYSIFADSETTVEMSSRYDISGEDAHLWEELLDALEVTERDSLQGRACVVHLDDFANETVIYRSVVVDGSIDFEEARKILNDEYAVEESDDSEE